MTAAREELEQLAGRVESERGSNNALDVLIEIALFAPDHDWAEIRANAAGTKTICTAPDGSERAFWARDYTISPGNRRQAAAALRAQVASS